MGLDLSAPHVAAYSQETPSADIAVIVPVYMGEPFIQELVERLHVTLVRISPLYQIVLVDDRGPDNSWALIEAEALKDDRVLGVRLSRNFGQHPAISAGIAHARAKWYVVMDCDLQDPPEAIFDLYQAAHAHKTDIVIAERVTSGLGVGRNIGSTLFNSVLSWASGLHISSKLGNFRIFSDQVAYGFRHFAERLRLFPAIIGQVGFSTSTIRVERSERSDGSSSYNIIKLVKLALETIVAYSEKPLWIMAGIGSTASFISILYGFSLVVQTLVFGINVPGFATLATLILFLGGLQIFITSLAGLYVGRTLDEVKGRPVFIVETIAGTAGIKGQTDGLVAARDAGIDGIQETGPKREDQ